MTRTIYLPLLACLAPAATAQSVWTVDAGGGGDFLEIGAAVAAAASGDAILVKTGDYAAFEVNGKGLVIHADAGAEVFVVETVTLRNIPEGEVLVLAGIDVGDGITNGALALELHDNAGAVWVQDGSFSSGRPGPFETASGAWVTNCNQVVFEHCELVGGGAGLDPPPIVGTPGNGLIAFDSDVFLFHTTCVGGDTDVDSLSVVIPPGNGAALGGGSLFAYGASFRGGAGKDGGILSEILPICTNGEDGGDGLVLNGAEVVGRLVASRAIGGPGGVAGGPACLPGDDGEGVLLIAATLESEPGLARDLVVPSPLRENESGALSVSGAPGELVWLLVSLGVDAQADAAFAGASLLAGAPHFVFLGVTDTMGELDVPFALGTFGNPARQMAALFEQGLFFNLTDGFTLGAGRHVLQVDEAF